MITDNTFTDAYIKNIPWNSHPVFAFSKDNETYLEELQALFNDAPVIYDAIDFNNDVWDFTSMYGVNNHCYRIYFRHLTRNNVLYEKFWVMYNLFDRVKVPTAYSGINRIENIISGIVSSTSHKEIELITTDDVVNYIESKNIKLSSKSDYYGKIYQFYQFIIANYKLNLPVDTKEFYKRFLFSNRNRITDKTPTIPSEYITAIIERSEQVMRNNTCSHNDRAIACIIIMLSQLGMRIQDLLSLSTSSLRHVYLDTVKMDAYYIHYAASKPTRVHEKKQEFNIVSNKLTTEAFNTLYELKKDVSADTAGDYLFTLCQENRSDAFKRYPIDKDSFRIQYLRYFDKYLNDYCTREWEGIKACSYIVYHNPRTNESRYRTINVPSTMQFRVYVCTYMWEHGIPLAYIRRFMGHLSEEMSGYYVRPADHTAERTSAAETVLSSMLIDDDSLIGFRGSELKNNIMKFLSENGLEKINAATDIHEIEDILGDRVIIRAKEGGVCACIKTTFMPCSQDAQSNEALCAYGDCPNIYRFYYHADVSYFDFLTAVESYTLNKEKGRKNEAQKEFMKIRNICQRKLMPQLNELDKVLAEKGSDAILLKYPSLCTVIDNESDIRKEISKWIS